MAVDLVSKGIGGMPFIATLKCLFNMPSTAVRVLPCSFGAGWCNAAGCAGCGLFSSDSSSVFCLHALWLHAVLHR
jgi:hypothetical protein